MELIRSRLHSYEEKSNFTSFFDQVGRNGEKIEKLL